MMAWKWLVRRTRESKPFFFAFATICGIVPGIIGYGVMTVTNTRSDQLESKLRSKARPESMMGIVRYMKYSSKKGSRRTVETEQLMTNSFAKSDSRNSATLQP